MKADLLAFDDWSFFESAFLIFVGSDRMLGIHIVLDETDRGCSVLEKKLFSNCNFITKHALNILCF